MVVYLFIQRLYKPEDILKSCGRNLAYDMHGPALTIQREYPVDVLWNHLVVWS